MQNTTHSRLTLLDPHLIKTSTGKAVVGLSQMAQTSWRSPLQNQSDTAREEDGQRWMEKQHLLIYNEKTPCTEMPTKKHLGPAHHKWIGHFSITLPFPHSEVPLEKKKIKKRKSHFTEFSRSPLLEAAAVLELPMPAGTANLEMQVQTQTSTCWLLKSNWSL